VTCWDNHVGGKTLETRLLGGDSVISGCVVLLLCICCICHTCCICDVVCMQCCVCIVCVHVNYAILCIGWHI